MMYQQVIARRYARGLMLAAPVNHLDAIGDEFSSLIDVVNVEGSDLAHLFSDPSFFPAEKKAVINQIADRYNLNLSLRHFLCLLVDKDRLKLLPLIHEAFVAFLDDHHGRMRALIKSASPVEDNLVADITTALNEMCKKQVLADVVVDDSLLAGLRVEIGGMVIDGSARAKLYAMKDQLVNSVEAMSV